MKKLLLLLAILTSNCFAGDLVMKLGTTGNFRYHRIPVTGNVTISPSTGDITIDPVSEVGTSGDGWCPVSSGGGNAPVFSTALNSNTTSLPSGGGNITLSWATSTASTCTANSTSVSGWNGNVVTSPKVLNLTAAGTYNFSLVCTNSFGSTNSNLVTVAVASPPVSSCSTRPAPTVLTRQFNMTNYFSTQQNNEFSSGAIIDVTKYVPLFGTSFNQANQVARAYINSSSYIAMAFTTPVTTGATGGVAWSQSGFAAGVVTVMISPCPGDFDWVTDGNCKTTSGESALTWKIGTKPATGAGFYCYIPSGSTYYINATFSNPLTGYSNNLCEGLYCDWLVAIGSN